MKVRATARTEIVACRMKPETVVAAQLVAALTGRAVSSLAEHALELYIRKNYPNAYKPGVTLSLSLHEAPTEQSP